MISEFWVFKQKHNKVKIKSKDSFIWVQNKFVDQEHSLRLKQHSAEGSLAFFGENKSPIVSDAWITF
jgi:hypothetical protein